MTDNLLSTWLQIVHHRNPDATEADLRKQHAAWSKRLDLKRVSKQWHEYVFALVLYRYEFPFNPDTVDAGLATVRECYEKHGWRPQYQRSFRVVVEATAVPDEWRESVPPTDWFDMWQRHEQALKQDKPDPVWYCDCQDDGPLIAQEPGPCWLCPAPLKAAADEDEATALWGAVYEEKPILDPDAPPVGDGVTLQDPGEGGESSHGRALGSPSSTDPAPQGVGEGELASATRPGSSCDPGAESPAPSAPSADVNDPTDRPVDTPAATPSPRSAGEGEVPKDPWLIDARSSIYHPSHLNMVCGCGLQFKLRYIDGIIRPPGTALITGKSVDAPVNADLQYKIDMDRLLPDEQIQDIAADTFDREWLPGEMALTREQKEDGEDRVRGFEKDRAVKLATLHHTEVAPKLYPTHVQRRLRISKLPGREFGISGTLDLQEPESVRDTKTAKASPSQAEADDSSQLTGYGLLVLATDKQAPDKYMLDKLVGTRGGKTYHRSLTTTRGRSDFRAYIEKTQMAHDYIKAGRFLPAPDKAWWCSPDWCGYWKRCAFGARARSGRPVS